MLPPKVCIKDENIKGEWRKKAGIGSQRQELNPSTLMRDVGILTGDFIARPSIHLATNLLKYLFRIVPGTE